MLPKIKLLSERDRKEPYPLSWEEQEELFNQLPLHLKQMALFAVNTGCREQEVCGLTWDMEVPIPQLDASAFIIPCSQSEKQARSSSGFEQLCQSRH